MFQRYFSLPGLTQPYFLWQLIVACCVVVSNVLSLYSGQDDSFAQKNLCGEGRGRSTHAFLQRFVDCMVLASCRPSFLTEEAWDNSLLVIRLSLCCIHADVTVPLVKLRTWQ